MPDRRRLFDLALTLPALPLVVPVLGLVALVVRLIDGRPVFFVQPRVGRYRVPFPLFKFRTMVRDAERVVTQVTAAGDARITRLGRFLRQWKLDELPQLVNVVRGEMSLVGPRPEVERYVRHYRPEWEPIFSVRPGITDEVSLVFRHEQELLAGCDAPEEAYREIVMPAKVELAMAALADPSVLHDVGILWRTLGAVLGRGGQNEHAVLVSVRERLRRMS